MSAAWSNTPNAAVVRLVEVDSDACIEVAYFNASYWQVVARTFDKDLRESRTDVDNLSSHWQFRGGKKWKRP